MHLAQRAYVLVLLTAVLCVVGIWSDEPALAYLWHIPAALLLLGLALEGWFIARLPLEAQLSSAPRAFLGRPQPATFQFANASPRPLAVHYTPAVPAGFETLARVRRVRIAARGTVRDPVTLLPVRLGPQPWPKLPARVLGPLRLAWWTRPLDPHSRIVVAPDALRSPVRPRGLAGGARPRRVGGAGAELHQLRAYAPGDPLARIDWKATARAGALITREFSEDQHLDILIGIDAGRFSRVRVGRLDRFGLYANLAARFAEVVTHHDDRIGLMVYADRVLASFPEFGDEREPLLLFTEVMFPWMFREASQLRPFAEAADLLAQAADLLDLYEPDRLARNEVPVFAPDGTFYLPDFTITWNGEKWFWEHWGLMNDDAYRNHTETKIGWYAKHFSERLVETSESTQLSEDADKLIRAHFS